MLSDFILRYLFVEWNPMGSMGIQRSPSMSIEITGLVANLTSDRCSINEIRLVLKAIKRNSSFQARMTWMYTLFFKALSKTVLYVKKILYAWNMAPSLSHEAKQLVSSANDLQRLTALEVDKCSKCGLLLNMPLFFKAMERNNPYQMRMT